MVFKKDVLLKAFVISGMANDLDDIKNAVIGDVILEKQNNAVNEYLKELRSKYQIEILADLNATSD